LTDDNSRHLDFFVWFIIRQYNIFYDFLIFLKHCLIIVKITDKQPFPPIKLHPIKNPTQKSRVSNNQTNSYQPSAINQ